MTVEPVYLLFHEHDFGDGAQPDVKLLGVYSTRERAESRRRQAADQPGFAEQPESFVIDEYVVDQDQWVAGYRKDL